MTDPDDIHALDRLKRLWQRYGTVLIVMAGLILIIIAGWQYWQQRQFENNTKAAHMYDKMVLISQEAPDHHAAITAQANQIIWLYPTSIYADFARLENAKQAIAQVKLDEATDHLQQVIKSPFENLAAIAKLRLARLEIAEHQPEAAINTLKRINLKGFNVSKNFLLGEAYFAQKDYKNAKSHWGNVLLASQKPALANIRNRVQMKIDNLAALSSISTAITDNTTHASL